MRGKIRLFQPKNVIFVFKRQMQPIRVIRNRLSLCEVQCQIQTAKIRLGAHNFVFEGVSVSLFRFVFVVSVLVYLYFCIFEGVYSYLCLFVYVFVQFLSVFVCFLKSVLVFVFVCVCVFMPLYNTYLCLCVFKVCVHIFVYVCLYLCVFEGVWMLLCVRGYVCLNGKVALLEIRMSC